MARTQREMAEANARRRLAPDERIAEILDAAAALVVEQGIAQLNMEKVARRAGVSKGLLYAYFSNVKALLQEVLLREHRALTEMQRETIARADGFETMARTTAHNNHVQRSERGILIERLRGDPEIAGAMRGVERRSRKRVIRYLSAQVTANFAIPEDVAQVAVELAIGPGHEYRKLTDEETATMDDVWGAMMVGAMKELERRYGGHVRKTARRKNHE